ncbi:unnamed protein product [Caenorhabditis nigoni]
MTSEEIEIFLKSRENNFSDINLCKLSDSQANSVLKQWIDGDRSNRMFMDLYAEHTFSEELTFKDITRNII